MAKKDKIIVPLQIIDLHEDVVHLLLEISIFGASFLVVLDTGASKTVFDKTRLYLANGDAVIIESNNLSTGLGTNSMASSTTVIPNLHIGTLLIDELEVAVLDLSTINTAYRDLGHPEVLGVLGGDILMKYKAVVDYGKCRLTLKK